LSTRSIARRRYRSNAGCQRVGIFGLLGSGSLGNDGSMEVMLAYLKSEHPGAVLGAMCNGPEAISDRYGIEATQLFWSQKYERTTSGLTLTAIRILGKVLDVARTAAWTRRHDVVIVPGAGVLEATLPIRAWQLPSALFVLCVSARLWGTRVALVSVGASVMEQRPTRWLQNSAARLASYRSYRDRFSLDAMMERGVSANDPVYPDLVFGFSISAQSPSDCQGVGVGIMAYYGGNDDRHVAEKIHKRYIETMVQFIQWLVDNGRRVRLLPGDSVVDAIYIESVRDEIYARRPNLDPESVVAEPVSTMEDLMREIALVDMVVSSRYHNIICALKLEKPTISIGYSGKHDVLMADMGFSEFCLSTRSFDCSRLITLFLDLEHRSSEFKLMLAERNAIKTLEIASQFATLSSVLFSVKPTPLPAHVDLHKQLIGSRTKRT
jgi:polysaccharide pyruvyl transferase WcaK-like protein